MRRLLLGIGLAAALACVCLVLVAAQYEPRARPRSFVGPVDVSGLTQPEAMRKVRLWWESEKGREIAISVPNGKPEPITAPASKLGLTPDDQGSVAGVTFDDFWENTRRSVLAETPHRTDVEMRFKESGSAVDWLERHVAESIGGRRPARVRLVGGAIVREPEVSGYGVDRSRLGSALVSALTADGVLEVPLSEAEKSVPDSELEKISDVVSEYTTSFPRSQTRRNANLRLASEKLDGVVLMPGDVFSFNSTVGERTVKDGYRLAGVYRNGRHDVGIGGGICQVSGTLYNAILLSNAKIVQRQNHSMPVPYLNVGRDATVDWGKIDLRFENSFDHPIAISSSFEPGKLTFRILGRKDPSLSVKIVTSDHRSWGRGVKYVHDGTLPPGKTKVIEKGSAGHSVLTYRVVYKDGVEVSRELLGRSHYAGGVRIVARNEKAMAAAPKPAEGATDAPIAPAEATTGG